MILLKTRKKEEEVDSDGPRLNEKITAEYVRLVSEEGKYYFIFTLFMWKLLAMYKMKKERKKSIRRDNFVSILGEVSLDGVS